MGHFTGIANPSNILDPPGSLLFFRFHKVVDFIVQLFDMGIEFIKMVEQDPHHLALEKRHNTIQVVNDLVFRGFQVMGNLYALHVFLKVVLLVV